MSSSVVMSKKSRFRLGIAVVVVIHLGFFYGFWHVKAKQLGDKFVNVDIYAPTAAEGLALYEALPTEDCVNVVNEQAPRPGMPVYVEPPADAKISESTTEVTAKNAKVTTATAPQAEVKLEPSLHYASSPRCKGIAVIPAGADQLGADGFVGLELNITKTGDVQRGEVHRSSGFKELDAAALKQVKENLIFKPCQKGDAIVGCKQYIKFRWKTAAINKS